MDDVSHKLDYFEESAKRLSKKDWANAAVGVIVTIAIDLATDPAKTRALFGLIGDFIRLISRPLLP